ncbi:ribulose-bisphosphate carboxylase large subunit family protein [Oceanicella sp. SM1341]|uniref:ribulose-bisphosphate carboxylase large subunit family protein n=1 Tax=Oceanicella sp. SM1341 TaxID=1548889 RepID=UPI000E54C8F5|nr:ribulose-bisphosphate carboxylase large subunit family protein [Oceanicella sp. SM1341]
MSRITATYDIETPAGLERAAAVLAGEQSTGTFVRLAAETDALRARSAARIESLSPTGSSAEPALPCRLSGAAYERARLTVSWPLASIGPSLPNLLSTVAGNLFELAEFSALRLTDITLPAEFGAANPGPQFGAPGTRALMGGHEGPLIGTIVKPSVGLSAQETAGLAGTLAAAGIDFIKDDELQANGPNCPLPERVAAVSRVLDAHAQRTGKRVLYAFNITDEVEQMWRNLELLEAHGALCAMVCVSSVGLTGLRALRDRAPMLVHGHRAGWGLYSRSPHVGIDFGVWQKLWRLAGADHLHVNGLGSKFTEPDAVVARSARSLQAPACDGAGPAHAAMPVFSSGQTVWQVDPSRRLLGSDDFIFCAGGGIMSHPGGPAAGVVALRQAAEAARDGVPIGTRAAEAPELRDALGAFRRPEMDLDGLF